MAPGSSREGEFRRPKDTTDGCRKRAFRSASVERTGREGRQPRAEEETAAAPEAAKPETNGIRSDGGRPGARCATSGADGVGCGRRKGSRPPIADISKLYNRWMCG